MYKRFALLLVSLLLAGSTMVLRSEPGTPARLITRFAFRQLLGGVIIVQGQLLGYPDTLNFLLDTGSGSISLDSATSDHLHLPHEDSHRHINGIAGSREVQVSLNQSLLLPGLQVDNLDFYINDYSIISSAEGMHIDGIIGYSFLRRYIVMINFDANAIEVWQPGELQYPGGGWVFHPLLQSLPMQNFEVKDAKTTNARFFIDTGADICFLANSSYIKDSSLLKDGRKKVPVTVQGFGGKRNLSLTIVKRVRIGPYRFFNVPTFIFDDPYNVTYYPQTCGLIGNDLLRRFNIILNYPNREIYIRPNGHYNDPFDYAYTGMSLFYEDGHIYIDDILKDSPAFKAGFMQDDEILAVNNTFSNDLSKLRYELMDANAFVSVILRRHGELKTIKFKVGSLQ